MKTALLLAVTLLGPGVFAAESRTEETAVVRTKDGLKFKLPPDWPIERRDGAVAPISVEEYVGRKFSAVEKRLQELEQQFDSLDLKVRILEEEVKRPKSVSRETAAESP